MIDQLFQTSEEKLLRIIVAAICIYVALIFLLRISGKRTLSKWNSFDFVVTVAFGSTFATALLSKDISVIESVLAFAMLITLQFLVTWLSVRFDFFQQLVKSKPSIIFSKGKFLEQQLKKKRVAKSELMAAIRAQGHSSLDKIDAVVLETDGSFSVINDHQADPAKSSLSNVEGFEKHMRNTSG